MMTSAIQRLSSAEQVFKRKEEYRQRFAAMSPNDQEREVLRNIAKRPLCLNHYLVGEAYGTAMNRLADKGLIEAHWHISNKGQDVLNPEPTDADA